MYNSAFLLTDLERKILYYLGESGNHPLIFLQASMDNILCWIPSAEKFYHSYKKLTTYN